MKIYSPLTGCQRKRCGHRSRHNRQENKNGTIKGKFRLLISFFNDAYGLYGELQAKAGFKGTRWGEVQSSMAEEGDPSQLDSALLEAVQKALKFND